MDRRIRLDLPGPGSRQTNNSFDSKDYSSKGWFGHGKQGKVTRDTGGAPPAGTINPYTVMHGNIGNQNIAPVKTKKIRIAKPVNETLEPKHTLYINNLNESIKPDELKRALQAVLKQFGQIVEIVAMKSMKRKGQAYVSFRELDQAVSAQKSMQGFPLFKKPLRIEFAKTDGDKIAKILGTYAPRPPRPPRPSKKQRRMIHAKAEAEKAAAEHEKMMSNPLTAPQKPIFEFGNGLAPPPPPDSTYPSYPGASSHMANSGYVPPPPPTNSNNTPPNNILFIERLPQDSTEIMITVLFNQFAGFKEVRLVPGRADIAFVEFDLVPQAAQAKQQLNNFKITPTHAIKVTFAKK